MFTKSEKLGLELKLSVCRGLKNLRKEVFVGSMWIHSSRKRVDRAEIAKNCFLRQPWS